MPCTKETVKASGLNIWSDEAAGRPAPEVDIIAVQGLGSHEFYTWVKKVSDKPKRFRDKARFWKGTKALNGGQEDGTEEVMWIRDLLVPKYKNARIATYSYKSDWRDRTVKTNLRECANLFLNDLLQHRQKENERQRPIVLIGHSLGCIVIQQALVSAALSRDFRDIGLSVVGIVFLGGPFQGSDTALWGTWLAQALRYDRTLLESLQKDSQLLFDIARDFADCHIDWDSVCFYETQNATYGPLTIQTVSQQSATQLGRRMIPLDTDHSGLNKFSGEDDVNFERVLPEIRRMVQDGGSIVTERYRANDTSNTPHGNLHFKVPRTVNRLFTGRAELLVRIETALCGDDADSTSRQDRFVITGLGGQGKSEICLQVANLMKDDFWGVFWVDVNKPLTAEQEFTAIAKLLGHVVETVSEALQVLATTHRKWLLILDNADDPDFDYQVYFPPGRHGAVLITSRIAECREYSPDAFEALEGLEEQDSKHLLLKAAGLSLESWPSQDNQAKEVVNLLGSHTLALIQAGAYICQGHCQLYQYPEVYKRQRERLLKYRPKQAQSRYRDVYATFEASADVLEQSQSESARDALCLLEILSMLDFSILPLQIFEEGWKGSREIPQASDKTRDIDEFSQDHVSHLPSFIDPEVDEWDPFRLTEASSLLISLSLVNRHDLDSGVTLSMHPLTHAWAKDRQDLKCQGVAWITTGCILGFSRLNIHMWQTQERRLLPHILSYLDIKVKRVFDLASKVAIIPIFLKCGWILLDMRQDSRLSQLLEDILLELKQNSNELSREFLPLYDLQARSLINIGKSKQAVALLEQVVQIRETIQAETHPSRLASQHELATAYQANGQVAEAVALLEQVVRIEETILAETHPARLASQHALAGAYQANGQVAEAVALLEQVVRIHEITLAKTHPDRLASQHALATAYQANGQVAEAVALLEQVVQIKETILAETHPARLASQHALAGAYQAKGQVAEAVALLEQVVQIEETILAETHTARLASQHALAIAYQANGQVAEAVALLEQVVQIRETTLAETHPSRLASQHALAGAYQANGQVAEAVALLEQVVQIRETTLAETHPSRLASQHELAGAYQANGQVAEAVALLEQVVQIEETILAETHTARLASQHALAIAYQANGQVAEAVALLEQVVQIKETILAETHPDRLASQHALAGAYQANGQVAEAVALLEQVVKIKRLKFPISHPSRIVSENALSYFLQLL